MLKLYNTLSKKKEEFKPVNEGKIGMYVCGPTVYDHCHLGHARGYVAMDILRKYLEYSGYEVRFIMNYTDVGHMVNDAEIGEDKIEKKARAEKIDPLAIANRYIESCVEDFKTLNIKPANFYPRPTQYIAQIIKFVEKLIAKGYAYETNGSVYFSVEKFPDYGKLSGKKTMDLQSGARIEINPEKKNPLDFALWIKSPAEHILKWESPWGIGYPGWHIECSVMSFDLLGEATFDIHGGGNENAFPHNENEIAQSEAYLGEKMANYWTLWNMVNVDGVKMSKSLGNFTTIKDALKKYKSEVIRLWILSSHYRSIINYSEESLNQATKNFKKIISWKNNLNDLIKNTKDFPVEIDFSHIYQKRFEEAMNDDLNTPLALSVIYELIIETNKLLAENKLSAETAKNILGFWERINKILSLNVKYKIKKIYKSKNGRLSVPEKTPKNIIDLAKKRMEVRINKDFVSSDNLRQKIEKLGYLVEDSKDGGYIIKKK